MESFKNIYRKKGKNYSSIQNLSHLILAGQRMLDNGEMVDGELTGLCWPTSGHTVNQEQEAKDLDDEVSFPLSPPTAEQR